MLKKLSVSIVALAAAIAAGTAHAITFGEPDGTRHPNVGGLVSEWNPDSPGPDQFCSGTLVSPTLFLTAAHCMVGWPADQQFWVTFDPEYDEEAANPSGLHAVTTFTTRALRHTWLVEFVRPRDSHPRERTRGHAGATANPRLARYVQPAGASWADVHCRRLRHRPQHEDARPARLHRRDEPAGCPADAALAAARMAEPEHESIDRKRRHFGDSGGRTSSAG